LGPAVKKSVLARIRDLVNRITDLGIFLDGCELGPTSMKIALIIGAPRLRWAIDV